MAESARDVIARTVAESHDEPDTSPTSLAHLFYFDTADAVMVALAAAGLTITETPDGFPVSSVAVAGVAQQIMGEGPRMVSSVWASGLLVDLLEGRR